MVLEHRVERREPGVAAIGDDGGGRSCGEEPKQLLADVLDLGQDQTVLLPDAGLSQGEEVPLMRRGSGPTAIQDPPVAACQQPFGAQPADALDVEREHRIW